MMSVMMIQAGRSRRRIAMMNATDLDEEDSLRYRVVEVQPVSGKKTFYVNPVTGALEVISDYRHSVNIDKPCNLGPRPGPSW